MCEIDPYFVPSRSSKLRQTSSHQIIEHKSASKKPSKKQVEPSSLKLDPTSHLDILPKSAPFKRKGYGKRRELSDAELEMKRLRFEVYKFVENSMASKDKQTSKKELALRLGAKPPKNDYVNYKLLLAKKKAEKEAAEASKKKNPHIRKEKTNPRNSEAEGALKNSAIRRNRKIGSAILKNYGEVKSHDRRKVYQAVNKK